MKVEQAKRAVTVVVQDSQIVLLAKIALDDKEVGAIALLSQRNGNFVCQELVDSLSLELLEQI
jgi:hypothetical protein